MIKFKKRHLTWRCRFDPHRRGCGISSRESSGPEKDTAEISRDDTDHIIQFLMKKNIEYRHAGSPRRFAVVAVSLFECLISCAVSIHVMSGIRKFFFYFTQKIRRFFAGRYRCDIGDKDGLLYFIFDPCGMFYCFPGCAGQIRQAPYISGTPSSEAICPGCRSPFPVLFPRDKNRRRRSSAPHSG